MLPAILAALVLLIGFFIWERGSRQGAEAQSFAAGTFDHGSTRVIATFFALGFVLLLAALLLDLRGIGVVAISPLVAWVGVVVMLLGVGLRIWANQVLGRFYTRTLHVAAGQEVVREGPYRLVRHPGYLGTILLWVGAGLATLNGIVFVVLALGAILAYSYRIHTEEVMLRTTLGEPYRAYMAHTWRLLPPIY